MNAPADPQQQESQIFLGRQPILNRNQDLVAYELLFRSGQQNFASFTDGVQATATVIVNAFTEMSLGEVLGHCRGFINVDENFLLSDVLELLPPQSVVLEILETVVPTPEVVARCRELKALGFTLALDDVIQLGPEYDELLELVSIIKVDLQPLSVPALEALVRQAKPLKKFLLAEKVDSQEQMQHCLDLGFDLFQGYYFAKPTVMTGKRLSPSHLSLMKLLGLVLADAEIHRLESAFKPEPGLTMNMLRLANSVGMGLTSRITSLKHALIVMGQRQLQRWLQLLLFAAGKTETGRNPLLQLAVADAGAGEPVNR
jgi:EAL and modified HD-GYP domain-containing signal transduction protein